MAVTTIPSTDAVACNGTQSAAGIHAHVGTRTYCHWVGVAAGDSWINGIGVVN